MKLLNVRTNYESPFVTVESISRVCTNKIDAHMKNIVYNMKYNPEAQVMNSIKFVVDLVKRGHLSILDHVQLSLEYAVKKSDEIEVSSMTDMINLADFNLRNNTAVSYKVYKDTQTPFIPVECEEPFLYIIKIEMNLRTLTEIVLAKRITDDKIDKCFKKNIIDKLLTRQDELALYLYLLEEEKHHHAMVMGAYAIDHIHTLFKMVSINTVSENTVERFLIPSAEFTTRDSILGIEYQKDHYKDICKKELKMVEKLETSMTLIHAGEFKQHRLTNNTKVLSAKLLNEKYLIEQCDHITPDTIFSFIITGPMPILEQILRHDTELGITKLSGRYTSFKDHYIYYRDGIYTGQDKIDLSKLINKLDEVLEDSKNNEVDRFWQPLGVCSLMVWSKPLRFLLPFLKDRLDPAAQLENRIIAEEIFSCVTNVTPETLQKLWKDIYPDGEYPKVHDTKKD